MALRTSATACSKTSAAREAEAVAPRRQSYIGFQKLATQIIRIGLRHPIRCREDRHF
jgi:hypothetical protein